MNFKVSTCEYNESIEMLSEIIDIKDNITNWCNNNVGIALDKLYDDWKRACKESSAIESDNFKSISKNLLMDCSVLQRQILQKASFFEDIVKDRIFAIKILSENNNEIKSLSEDVFTQWNEKDKPRLLLFFEKTEDLDLMIRNIVNL